MLCIKFFRNISLLVHVFCALSLSLYLSISIRKTDSFFVWRLRIQERLTVQRKEVKMYGGGVRGGRDGKPKWTLFFLCMAAYLLFTLSSMVTWRVHAWKGGHLPPIFFFLIESDEGDSYKRISFFLYFFFYF